MGQPREKSGPSVLRTNNIYICNTEQMILNSLENDRRTGNINAGLDVYWVSDN